MEDLLKNKDEWLLVATTAGNWLSFGGTIVDDGGKNLAFCYLNNTLYINNPLRITDKIDLVSVRLATQEDFKDFIQSYPRHCNVTPKLLLENGRKRFV